MTKIVLSLFFILIISYIRSKYIPNSEKYNKILDISFNAIYIRHYISNELLYTQLKFTKLRFSVEKIKKLCYNEKQ